MDDVGEVSVDGGTTLRWTIPRYTQRPHGVDTGLLSPPFTFRGEGGCYLCAYPNGLKWKKTEGWTGIACLLPSLPPASTVTCCLVSSDGREILHTETQRDDDCYSQLKWILRRELEARKEEILPGGTLRVVVRVVLPDEGGHRAEEASGMEKVLDSLKNLFLSCEDSDFIIRVNGREFKTHRCILKSRVPYFRAMLSHDTQENRENQVTIEDSEPDIFSEFLHFVYCGSLNNISAANMFSLYELSDKYGVAELKALCLHYIKLSVSVPMILDVIRLAVSHHEDELLEFATNYFIRNAQEVMATGEWDDFYKENGDLCKELFEKTVQYLCSKIQLK